jgi:ATP-dependent Lon protease
MSDKDINDFIKNLRTSNKRKYKESSNEEIINDIKWIAYETIVDFVNTSKSKTNRQISVSLNILEQIFKDSSKLFIDMTKDEDLKLTLNAFSCVLSNIIEDMRLEIYSNKNFNFNKYIKSCQNNIRTKRAKLIDDVGLKFDIAEDAVVEENTETETTDDEDYIVDEEDVSGDTEEMEEMEEMDEEYNEAEYIGNNKEIIKSFHNELKESTNKHNSMDDLMEYFSNLDDDYKNELITKFKKVNNHSNDKIPSLIKVLNMNTSTQVKKTLISKMNKLNGGFGDKSKLQTWMEHAMKIPFGVYKGVNIKKLNQNQKKVTTFLNKLRTKMDNAIYGHDKAKEQVMMMMAQNIRNPDSKGNVFGLWGPPGNGKCFLRDTKILMYDGSIKNVQDITVGEQIMGDDSKPRNVLSLGNGTDKMYDIISKNEKYTVNSEHILCLKTSGLNLIKKKENKFKVQYFNTKTYKINYKTFNNYDDANNYLFNLVSSQEQIVEITVNDYLKLPEYIKNKLKGYKSGVEFKENKILFDPYIIGLWLGDGSSSTSEITNQDSVILFYLRNKLKEYNLNLTHRKNYTYYIGCDTKKNTRQKHNTFINILNIYDLMNNKHIPNVYKINSRDNRLKLLAGIIDSDGHYNKKMKNYEIIQKNKKLSEDIVFLARSLGYACYNYPIEKSCMYNNVKKTGIYYRLIIYGDNLEDIPVLCPRKKHQISSRYKNALVNNVEVKFSHIDKYYGFMIDGNQRFLLGNFTVTHNTSLIKEGIAKAMKKPFIFISLGGATDASYLDGHSYTYEGSIYGRIVQGLIDSKCMDPIIYFDELDKVSTTPKGDEIINLLIHMIDPSQNTHFKDKYFYDLDIDLSKVTFIFSFNEPSNVNYILMDRITSIETKYLTTSQKVKIGKDYLLPSIMKDVGLNLDDINISIELIDHLVLKYTYEGGVRKLKQLLYEIVRRLNQSNLTRTKLNKHNVEFPYELKLSHLDILLKDYRKINRDKIHSEPQIGMVNGLWANSMGIGGVLPIESSLIPAKDFMNVKATGSLKNVMKESIQVALSVAWNYLDDEVKKQYMEKWENKPETFHIHCPDGAVPKDGPSAGAAMTLVMYSHLSGITINNKVAMTGEINLRGNVTAIGGLEEKLVGAKLAGVELALIPEENREDFEKILSRIPKLVDDTFRVEIISHFRQIPDLVK